MPGKLAALVSDDPQARSQALRFCEGSFLALEEAEREALTQPALRDVLRQLLWPRSSWIRELLIGLGEAEWQATPDDIRVAVESMFRGPGGSKDSEDTFNVLRRCASKTSTGGLQRATQWHRSIHSSILEEAGKKQPERLAADMIGVSGKVPSSCFDARSSDFSLGDDAMDKYLGGKWGAAPSPAAWLGTPLAHHALVWAERDWQKLLRTWLSCLLMVGTAIVHYDDLVSDSVLIVIKVGAHGAYCWKARAIFVDGVSWVALQHSGPEPISIVHIHGLSEWVVFRVQSVLPFELRERFGGQISQLGLSHVTLRFSSEQPSSLLNACAAGAFRHMTVQRMKGIAKFCGFRDDSGRVPATEVDLCRLLVQRVLHTLSAEEADDIVALRAAKKMQAFASSVKESDMSALEEVLQNDQVAGVDKEVFAKKRAAAASSSKAGVARRPGPQPQAAPAPEPAPAAASASSSSGDAAAADDAARARRPLRPIVGAQWTAMEAREFLPAARGVSISIHTERSWQAKYLQRTTPGPKSHMRTWSADVTHRDALLAVLSWVWARHAEATGESCPWELR